MSKYSIFLIKCGEKYCYNFDTKKLISIKQRLKSDQISYLHRKKTKSDQQFSSYKLKNL